ncbi:flagellar motor protein MotB [Fibrisoma montanum]|uniref:Flagellar motor protein MotB n=1 Tax=Fibrisoma montanum TaxID=2305895 RepID=A0A418MC58_9BACT|nr:OmpA family protein [Fibrisoma montanum]RIV23906.1 flagellar motor protein MotB [Fibrisoma montanum]
MLTNKTPWIILLVLWMAGSTWWHVCKIKQLCPEFATADTNAQSTADTPAQTPTLTISDGDRFRQAFPGTIQFPRSGANAGLNGLGGTLDSLVTYLKANPGRTLTITGYYDLTETNPTSFDNLGLARAEALKQYLVGQGVPTASLATQGRVQNDLTFDGDSLVDGLAFAFGTGEPAPAEPKPAAPDTTATVPASTSVAAPLSAEETALLPKTEEGLAKAEKFTSVFEPIDLYFPLAEANFIRTDETQKFFKEAAAYLAEHKDKRLVVTGYTDSAGPDDVNQRLSRDRANTVKARLRRAGIDAGQIEVIAKGEADPKASNETREGRRANRRVSVVVK